MIIKPNWDEFWMKMALLAATRSSCLRYCVGAVLVVDKRLISLGYNGPVSGDKHCADVGVCQKSEIPAGEDFCRGAHAELNAISNAAYLGVSIKGASLYCTWSPCFSCAKQIVNSGIKRIIFLNDYEREPQTKFLFRRTGVDLIPFKELSGMEPKQLSVIWTLEGESDESQKAILKLVKN